jgi:putative tryptophan/tyrosine transport system substrate-binding protein
VRRREFITLLSGSAIIWPDAMFAQGSTKRPLIAWLSGGEQKASWVFVEAFLQGMHEHGYVEGHSFDIVYRFADGYFERLPVLAEGLVQLHPDVILAPASGPAVAANKATSTIPIVTPALADAMHLGLIASESRPGGNVTGITPYVAGLPAKQMELAREVVPSAATIGVLANSIDPKGPPQWHELEAAGQLLGVKVIAADVRTPDDLDGAFQALARQGINVLIVLQTSMLLSEPKNCSTGRGDATPGRLRLS